MSLVVIGLNHRTTPVELLERMAVPSPELPKALHTLERSENLAEVAVLSTCNRTEVYARCTRFHPAVEDVRNFLTDQSSLDRLHAQSLAQEDDIRVQFAERGNASVVGTRAELFERESIDAADQTYRRCQPPARGTAGRPALVSR